MNRAQGAKAAYLSVRCGTGVLSPSQHASLCIHHAECIMDRIRRESEETLHILASVHHAGGSSPPQVAYRALLITVLESNGFEVQYIPESLQLRVSWENADA